MEILTAKNYEIKSKFESLHQLDHYSVVNAEIADL